MGSRYWYCTVAEHISFVNPAWCHSVAQQTGLSVERIDRFSHSATNRTRRLKELAKNVTYMVTPGFMAWLRRKGYGGKDARTYAALADHPPPWPSAKDHFVALFSKTSK
jgi:hypothetical protein